MYRDLIGIPFQVHGRDNNGYDCLGLSIEIFKRNGIMLNDVGDIENGLNLEPVETLDNLTAVLMQYHNREHIAVYIGNGMIIHATEDMGVVTEPYWRYKSRVKGLYKVSTCNHL